MRTDRVAESETDFNPELARPEALAK